MLLFVRGAIVHNWQTDSVLLTRAITSDMNGLVRAEWIQHLYLKAIILFSVTHWDDELYINLRHVLRLCVHFMNVKPQKASGWVFSLHVELAFSIQ